jgi:hypothetical protein
MRLAWLLSFVACAPVAAPANPPAPAPGPADPADPVAAPETATPPETPTPPEPAPPAPPRAPMVTSGDLDGVPGDEQVVLAPDGTLTAGTATIAVKLDEFATVFADQLRLEVVSLGRKRRGVVVTAPTSDSEDPPNRYQVFLYDQGTLRPVFDQVIGVYGVTPLVFAPDGTASYTESGWMACTRKQNEKRVKPHRVSLTLDAANSRLIERSRKPVAPAQRCDELAACPLVYRLGDGDPLLLGEILRDVRGAAAATVQTLAVGARGAGPITLRLAEEKLEVTFLDEVHLEVDDARVAPIACDGAEAPAYCLADGRHHVLREGDSLDLEFATPPHATSRLVARGYYVPTPTTRIRARRSGSP